MERSLMLSAMKFLIGFCRSGSSFYESCSEGTPRLFAVVALWLFDGKPSRNWRWRCFACSWGTLRVWARFLGVPRNDVERGLATGVASRNPAEQNFRHNRYSRHLRRGNWAIAGILPAGYDES